MIYAASALFALVVCLTIFYLNERHGLLSCDRFPSATAKWVAYAWLTLFFVVMAYLVTGSALSKMTAKQVADIPFYSLFGMHVILVVFLLGWWAATGFPEWREFLNVRHERPAEVVSIGVAVGVGGWIFTIVMAMLVGLALQATGALEQAPEPPAMIGMMATMAWWKKALIILSAMTVEEAFFRSFLQKRVGLVASTILFALAHFTYGNPLMLIGVTVISLVIGVTFYRTKNVIPGVIAHGVFDAIQLFVIVPFAVKMMGLG
ncbi:MAG: CPBP family intramembrane metalloprotease [Acidobacteriota bacterium]|nr:CPBP family intramembrane metalloprotease [Acidobacteriota bacterium]